MSNPNYERQHRWVKANPEKFKASQRKHRQTAKYKAKIKARRQTEAYKKERVKSVKAWRDRNPQKDKAQRYVALALFFGDLVRGLCEITGCLRPTVAHHDNYTKPLEVRWLCRQHHAAVHNST